MNGGNSNWSRESTIHWDWGNPNLYLDQPFTNMMMPANCTTRLLPDWQSCGQQTWTVLQSMFRHLMASSWWRRFNFRDINVNYVIMQRIYTWVMYMHEWLLLLRLEQIWTVVQQSTLQISRRTQVKIFNAHISTKYNQVQLQITTPTKFWITLVNFYS